MMLMKTVAAGLIALAGIAAASPANAQRFSFEFGYGGPPYGYEGDRWRDRRGGQHRTLSPREVRRILRDQGFRDIDYIDRRGSIYQVEATHRSGRRLGLVVSARSGEILNRYRL